MKDQIQKTGALEDNIHVQDLRELENVIDTVDLREHELSDERVEHMCDIIESVDLQAWHEEHGPQHLDQVSECNDTDPEK